MVRREYSPPKHDDEALSDMATELYVKLRDLVSDPGDEETRETARKLCRTILARLG